MKNNSVVIAIVAGIAFFFAAIALGISYYQTKKPVKTVSVVGLAEKDFTSDLIVWNLSYDVLDQEGKTHIYGYPIWFAFILTFFVGMCSGLFGIGGGSMIVPAMLILFLFPPHVAVATSMFLVFLTSLVNSASHIYLGNVPWLYTLPVVPGAYIGAKLGSILNKRLNSKTLVVVLRIVLLLLGIRSIVDALI